MTIGYLIPLWLGPALQFALVLVILRRRIFLHMFPAFFGYTCYAVAANIVEILVIRHPLWYFWVYWTTNLICGLLALFVMRGILQTIWDTKQSFRRFTVWVLLLALSGVATIWGMNHPDGHGRFAGLTASIDTFVAGVHLLEVIVCCVVLLLARRFNQYQIGIMLGFAASAIVAVLAYVGYYHPVSPGFSLVVRYAPVSAYMASAGAWLLTFLSRPKFAGKFDPEAALDLLRRQEELARTMAAGVGLKWPGDKQPRDPKRSADAANGTLP